MSLGCLVMTAGIGLGAALVPGPGLASGHGICLVQRAFCSEGFYTWLEVLLSPS